MNPGMSLALVTCNTVRYILAAAIIATGSGFIATPNALAQETCYQDDDGRIVTRRRPGYREVPCPLPDVPQSGDDTAAEPAPSDAASRADLTLGTREQAGRPERTRNAVSPVPRPGLNDFVASVPLPDRWRIVDAIGYTESIWDPYNRNLLKADRPVKDDKFFNITIISAPTHRAVSMCLAARINMRWSQTSRQNLSITRAIRFSGHRIMKFVLHRYSISTMRQSMKFSALMQTR